MYEWASKWAGWPKGEGMKEERERRRRRRGAKKRERWETVAARGSGIRAGVSPCIRCYMSRRYSWSVSRFAFSTDLRLRCVEERVWTAVPAARSCSPHASRAKQCEIRIPEYNRVNITTYPRARAMLYNRSVESVFDYLQRQHANSIADEGTYGELAV